MNNRSLKPNSTEQIEQPVLRHGAKPMPNPNNVDSPREVQILRNTADLTRWKKQHCHGKKRLGLISTKGAIHSGHLGLSIY